MRFGLFIVASASGARGDTTVALLGEPPPGHQHTWVGQWLGTYAQADAVINGLPTFAKIGDPHKVMWCNDQGHWHCGRAGDARTGNGLFAARQTGLSTPDQTTGVLWQIATQGRGWTDAPGIVCSPAPPPTVWLFGYALSSGSWWFGRGWVASWLGAFDLHPELTNGRVVYARRGDTTQLLWFARSESEQPYWFLGPASDLGSSRGWLSVLDDAPLPHLVNSSWRVASANDNATWVEAPGLRVTASESEVVGWYRSALHVRWTEPSDAALAVLGPLADGADTLLRFVEATRVGHAHRWPALRRVEGLAEGIADFVSQRLGPPHPQAPLWAPSTFVWLWLVALTAWAVACLWVRRRRRLREEEEGEYDIDADAEAEVDSCEEKRLAFACLSAAIEEVKERVSEQQYLELYSAALWCFNLTPQWAGTVPQPPTAPADGVEAPTAGAQQPAAESETAQRAPAADSVADSEADSVADSTARQLDETASPAVEPAVEPATESAANHATTANQAAAPAAAVSPGAAAAPAAVDPITVATQAEEAAEQDGQGWEEVSLRRCRRRRGGATRRKIDAQ